MKKLKVLLTLILGLVILPFVNGCGNKQSEMKSDITYSTKLTEDFAGKTFTTDGIGEVKFQQSIDGDTSIFKEGDNFIKVRYYGVNTPESTAKIEPWGRAASSFTKEHIMNADSIVLQRDPSSDEFDSSGSRYLALVWIKDKNAQDYYCLNLKLVEHAFSGNNLNDPRSPYLQAFLDAENYAKSTKRRVHGEEDTSIDTSGKIIDVTIQDLLKDFDKYNNGADLHVKAIVSNRVGNNFYVTSKGSDGKDYSIYVYGGFDNIPSIKRGDEIDFYCKAGIYQDVPQLTNVYVSSHGDKPFKIVSRDNEVQPIKLTGNETNDFFASNAAVYAEADLEIIHVPTIDKMNKDFTIICKFIGTDNKFDIRCTPKHKIMFLNLLEVGKKVKAKGSIGSFTPMGSGKIYYQINIGTSDNTGLTEIK